MIRKHLGLLLIFFLFIISPIMSQPPASEIYLVDVSYSSAGEMGFRKPINITHRKGYDNQPSFSNDGKFLYYVSIREDKQADIYKYEIATGTTTQFTKTTESEYSPTETPDGKYISVVRVEKDSAQRIWKFPLNGNQPELVFKKVDSIGYHCWITNDSVALFVLGKPERLTTVGKSMKTKAFADHIGRCTTKIPGTKSLSFISKRMGKDSITWRICRLDENGKVNTIVETLKGSEDYCWTSTGKILMAQGPIIYSNAPAQNKKWNELINFSSSGIKKINRISLSSDSKKLAIVVME